MVDVSVVIVNYNVRHFLEMTLYSVFRASQGLAVEVIVVDNNSHDDSCNMVRSLFPDVKLIANTDNPGFGIANNQGIRMAKGRYVLLLNPDTIVAESTILDCLSFMNGNAGAGALGVHMINGDGVYLRESKRGLPTPAVSFYKMSGLINLFPKSKVFARYYIGHLPDDEVVESEILSGAFMFIRREALEKAGLFDEDFFMYGEDIDLSYRIAKAGFTNYCLGKTPIIHFKGESTKKGSLNYVIVFYRAMEIFARKHFTGGGWSPYRLIIELAIKLRTLMSIIHRVFWPVTRLFAFGSAKEKTVDSVYVVSDDGGFCAMMPQLSHLSLNVVRLNVNDFCSELRSAISKTNYRSVMVVFDVAKVGLSEMMICMKLFRDKGVLFRFVTPHGRIVLQGSNA
jgi:GT2 family glycosyltransferase